MYVPPTEVPQSETYIGYWSTVIEKEDMPGGVPASSTSLKWALTEFILSEAYHTWPAEKPQPGYDLNVPESVLEQAIMAAMDIEGPHVSISKPFEMRVRERAEREAREAAAKAQAAAGTGSAASQQTDEEGGSPSTN